MKAIQIRFLSPTNTKGARLKAFTDAGSITEGYDYIGADKQALRLAMRYLKEKHWGAKITGSGVIPNGDWVFTIG